MALRGPAAGSRSESTRNINISGSDFIGLAELACYCNLRELKIVPSRTKRASFRDDLANDINSFDNSVGMILSRLLCKNDEEEKLKHK
ncbi:hypothetical protein GWI33_023403 [Rhynchophorus ferrugineus]|uniref:Uncharacterized protein n=1 Tax=Rhynchophorus ferrugineus TaxID=354439 RepID=A0A834MHB6_RHYFE|nr:hypothetical protein GWI33_023403 [Rhynchophorus ferrugineus]